MAAESEQGAPPDVTVGVLGNLEVHVDGAPVRIGHARRKAVLAVLLVEANRVIPADRLIDRVWGEQVPDRSRSVLRTYLSHLRRALAGTGIMIMWRDIGYRLAADPNSVDLHRFRHLLARARDSGDPQRALALADEALALWRGEPLAELDTPWAQSVREHLHRERAAAQTDRTDWALECGRHGDLLPELTTQTAEHPLDERLAGQLMVALYRSGRQADALEHYQHTRRQLAEGLGADPCPALQGLHQRILTADPALALLEAATPRLPATGQAAPPRQLPAAPAPFVGRRDELDRLDAALPNSPDTATTVVISAIAGAGGIGKTWLALHWAHRHLDHFPDGQLFVDLRGFSPDSEPMNPAVAVRGFIDALGIDPGRLPTDPHAQAALFRSLVAGRRMLIVLDNAADTGHVTALLPGSRSCTVLVTSRNLLTGLVTGHSAHHLPLDVLSADEARALLRQRLGTERVEAEPAAVDELVALCHGFPLALGIVAGHACTQPDLSLAAQAAELRELGLDALDNDDPAASLPAVLSWSHRALSPERTTAFALLGVAPGPDIGLPAATSLLGLPPERTRKVLQALVGASLIERDAHGRYTMHDLIRDYATTLAHDLSEPTRQTALKRVVDFYLHTAYTAERRLNPYRQPIGICPPDPGIHPYPLSDDSAAMAWLEVEHLHVLAAQHTATTHGWHDTVWQLAWTLHTFHARLGHRRDNLVAWQAALVAAEHLTDPGPRTLVHRLIGAAHARLGQHESAIGHLHRALTLAEHHHNTTQQAHTHQDLAQAWERRGADRKALDNAQRALDLYRILDHPAWEADALNNVGWYVARLGDHDTARIHCQAALTLHQQHHNPTGEAAVLDSLGWIDYRTSHHTRAINYYRQALALRRALGHTHEVANTLADLGHPHAALDQYDQARAVWKEALELYRQQGCDTDAERVQRQLDALDHSVGDRYGSVP